MKAKLSNIRKRNRQSSAMKKIVGKRRTPCEIGAETLLQEQLLFGSAPISQGVL